MTDAITADPGSYISAKQTYIERVMNLNLTPREQLNDFKKRNKPSLIINIKPLQGGGGEPIILRKPVAIDQGGKASLRQKSLPHKVK